MASPSDLRPTTLELTRKESQLRDLLLGVATYIDNFPQLEEDATGPKVPNELKNDKIVLRWTGGWVRDKLLGVVSHDVDVAINKMTGKQFGLKMLEYVKMPGIAEKHGLDSFESNKILSGLHTIKANPEASKHLETATIKFMGIDLDLVNLRKETYNEVSRNPEMEFGTAEEDAMRRDATVNAMFYNLSTNQIEDLTGRGFNDMEAKIIRTPLEPYQTFKDDPLRVLRLIRFASRLGYTIESYTAAAMGNKDIQEALKIKIKRERVGIELEKMLSGPDPYRALYLIDQFSLYQTIFTDPTRAIDYSPEPKHFSLSYEFVNELKKKTEDSTSKIVAILLRNSEEEYLSWICAAVMPWADAPGVPHPKVSRPPYHAAYLVAQEGFKAPNKVCDVIAASLNNGEDIRGLVERCYKQLQQAQPELTPGDYTSREALGMAIRRWGSTWRTQVLFSLIYETVRGSLPKDQICRYYSAFLGHLAQQGILDADTLKPLVNGNELARAMGMKPGPWMKDALDEVIMYQLMNPDVQNPAEVIEAVKKTRKSELPSRLISRFLSLTIGPLFAQTSDNIQPWKSDQHIMDMLKWTLANSDAPDIQKNIHILRPSIMHMLRDHDLEWKARGCKLLNLLLESASPLFLSQKGYDRMFESQLWPLFSYLPSETPEKQSVNLLSEVFPALITLDLVIGPNSAILDRMMREGFHSVLLHLGNPLTYPDVATLVVSQLSVLLDKLMLNSVRHLHLVLPHLENLLNDTFAATRPLLLLAAVKAAQSVVRNGWPRIGAERAAEIYCGGCRAWLRCRSLHVDSRDFEEITKEVRTLISSLNSLMDWCPNEQIREAWERERRSIMNANPSYRDLVDGL